MKYITIIALACVLLTGCEKVIEIDLNDADKKYVVEAFLSNQNQGAEVRLSRTTSFSSNNAFNGISGAQISLTNNLGNSYTFTETGTGIYKTAAFSGMPGVTYNIAVTIGGQTFTASSAMPQPVTLDSAYTEIFAAGADDQINVVPVYNDPAGIANQYRFRLWVNGVEEDNTYAYDDLLSDGRRVTRPLFNNDSDIKTGDQVTVQMQCIDRPIYTYWYSLSQQAANNPGGGATPANPVSNFSGGCLGYFSAHTVSSRSFIVR
jgi:Domain of unknown function (DUF4249)